MVTELQWEEHRIRLHCQPMAKYFWLATETVMLVDDEEIGRVGGFRFTEKIEGEFNSDNNETNNIVLDIKVDLLTLISVPYKLFIDGEIVSDDRLNIDNWYLFLIPTILFVMLTLCACVTGVAIIFLSSG